MTTRMIIPTVTRSNPAHWSCNWYAAAQLTLQPPTVTALAHLFIWTVQEQEDGPGSDGDIRHGHQESSEDEAAGADDDDDRLIRADDAKGPPAVIERLQQTIAAANALPQRVAPTATTSAQLQSAVRTRTARVESDNTAAQAAEAQEAQHHSQLEEYVRRQRE